MTATILAALCAVTASVLIHGTGPELFTMVPLCVALGFSSGGRFTVGLAVIALSVMNPQSAVFVLPLGGVYFAVFGQNSPSRISGFAGVALWTAVYATGGTIPLVAVSAAGVILDRRNVHPSAVAMAVAAALFFSAPSLLDPPGTTVRGFTRGDTLHYSAVTLRDNCRGAVFPAPVSGSWLMCLHVDAGGVRDTLPMFSLEFNEELLFLPGGRDTLCFSFSPGDTLIVNMMGNRGSFNHPAVHLDLRGEAL